VYIAGGEGVSTTDAAGCSGLVFIKLRSRACQQSKNGNVDSFKVYFCKSTAIHSVLLFRLLLFVLTRFYLDSSYRCVFS